MAANPQGCHPAAYARHRPEQTVLYRLVQQHRDVTQHVARLKAQPLAARVQAAKAAQEVGNEPSNT